jgi:hypothetical protein
MPNRSIYLTPAQDQDFRRGRQAARALEVSVGEICAKAMKEYADNHTYLIDAITQATEEDKPNA